MLGRGHSRQDATTNDILKACKDLMCRLQMPYSLVYQLQISLLSERCGGESWRTVSKPLLMVRDLRKYIIDDDDHYHDDGNGIHL